MALFKIFKGEESNLPANTTEGYAYFTTDEGNFFIDVEDNKFDSHAEAVTEGARIQINANNANFADSASIAEFLKGTYNGKTITLDIDEILRGMAYGQGEYGQQLITAKTGNPAWTNYYVKGTQTAATNAWTGDLPNGITEYYEGLTIDYLLPYAGTSTAATLKLGSLAAVPVRRQGNSTVTTHFPAGSVIRLTYVINNSNVNSGNSAWEVSAFYHTDNTVRLYRQTTSDTDYNTDTYPLLVSRTPASSIGTKGTSGSSTGVTAVMNDNTDKVPTLNPNTGVMTVPGGVKADLEGNAQSATSDGNGNNIASTYIKHLSIGNTANSSNIGVEYGDNTAAPVEVSLPIASTTSAGLITADKSATQTFTGNKVIDSNGSLTIQKAGGFIFSGLQEAFSDAYRSVWFNHSDTFGIPVHNSNFQYNPKTDTLKVGNVTGNASSATSLETKRTIALSTGVVGTATGFDGSANITIPVTSIKESYLTWGGKNFTGSYGPLDASLIDELGANRFMFLKADGITIEYSRDSGSTWTDYDATDSQKTGLFSSGATFSIGKADSSNKATSDYQLRVTINTSAAGIYTELNKFCLYIATNGSSGCTCTIQKALQSTPDTYVTIADAISISGWSAYNIINVSQFRTYGNTETNQYGRIRFIFKCTGGSTSYTGLQVYKIMAFGGVGWTTPSTMAKTGHLYSFDAKQNATFPNNIKTSSGDIIASTGNLYIKQSSEDKNSTGNATIEGKVIVGDSITVKDGAGQVYGNASSADQVNHNLYFGSKSNSNYYNGLKDVILTPADLGLESAFRFIGIVKESETQVIEDGTESNSVIIKGETEATKATTGDVILYETKDGYKYKEFVWADSHWEELGDENSYKIYANELVNALDYTDTMNGYVSVVNQTDGQISVTHHNFILPKVGFLNVNESGYSGNGAPLIRVTSPEDEWGPYTEMPAASGTTAGVVTTKAQTFAGQKKFVNQITADGGLASNGTVYVTSADGVQITEATGTKYQLSLKENNISVLGKTTDATETNLYINNSSTGVTSIGYLERLRVYNTSKLVSVQARLEVSDYTTDSTYSKDTNASITTDGGVSVQKQLSAKSVRIDNNQSDKGCTVQFNETDNCISFVFD